MEQEKKYCKYCGELIFKDAVMCPKCGRQVESLSEGKTAGNIIVNANSSSAASSSAASTMAAANPNTICSGKRCSKWTAFFLCLFFGGFGAHKFYEGKIGSGILYLFTFGIFGIGWLIDIFNQSFEPAVLAHINYMLLFKIIFPNRFGCFQTIAAAVF